MATRQYIGARYVPKFYDNPNGTNDWVKGIPYEALTVVTYAGVMWISKIPVPSNIAEPNLNPEYWLAASMDGISSVVAQIKTNLDNTMADVETNTQNISENSENIEKIFNLKTFLTPEQFGAKGDGVTDDYNAFQACLDATANSYKYIYLQNDKYYISKKLEVNNMGTTIFGRPHKEYSTNIVFSPTANVGFHVTVPRVEFYNITISPTGTTQNDAIAVHFDLTDNSDCDGSFVNCSILYYTTGIKLSGKNLEVFNSLFSHCKVGIHFFAKADQKQVQFRGLFISECRFHNCGFEQDYSAETACIIYDQSNSQVINQFFITNNYADLGTTFIRGQLQGGFISNNYIVSNHSNYAIHYDDKGQTYYQAAICEISNNYIHGIHMENGIYVNGGYRIVISNNIICNPEGAHIKCNGGQAHCIMNNKFQGGDTDNNYIIDITGCNEPEVIGNMEVYTATVPKYSLSVKNTAGAPSGCRFVNGVSYGDISMTPYRTEIAGSNGTVTAYLYKSGNIATIILAGNVSGTIEPNTVLIDFSQYTNVPNIPLEIINTFNHTDRLAIVNNQLQAQSTIENNTAIRGYFTYPIFN